MQRSFRLTRSDEFARVRKAGISIAHPMLVLIWSANSRDDLRVGVSAGRSVGGAVQRNRSKRLLREAMRPLLSSVSRGKDVVIVARAPILQAKCPAVQSALKQLLMRAGLLSTT